MRNKFPELIDSQIIFEFKITVFVVCLICQAVSMNGLLTNSNLDLLAICSHINSGVYNQSWGRYF